MNSLVVLFSVMVLASAKPSVPAVISYAAPAVAIAPAAVSHQSRVDIKSTPAIVKTDIVSPAIAPAVVAAPIAYSAPLAVSHQSRVDIKSTPAIVKTDIVSPAIAPAVVAAPIAYSAPLAVAPAAVSSHIDIKSAPGLITAPLPYGAHLAYGAPLAYNAHIAFGAPLAAAYAPSIYSPAVASAIAPTLLKTAVITPAVETPASIASPDLPVAPTETPEVAAARAAHLEAKAIEESSHQIQKRSVGIVATSPIVTGYASSPVIYSAPITRIAPVGYPTPYLTGAYGIHHY